MYHTLFQSQMIVQIMGGRQAANGQCPPTQNHSLHINGVNALHQSDIPHYGPNISGHNRHRAIQHTESSQDLLQLIKVDVPIRRIEYMQPNNNSSISWERRINTSSNSSVTPFSNYNYKSSNTNLTKKPNWNNRNNRQNSYRNFSKYETYNDSGFNSRSSTPNKHYIDNSLTESSDERDSTSSVRGQWLNKKHHKTHSENRGYNNSNRNSLISNTSAHQFYSMQRSNGNYNNHSMPRQHIQNYQNKRRYLSDKNENGSLQRFSRNRKCSDVSSYGMFPGSITAPDRFLARSHLIQITSTPNNLVTGSSWDDLSKQIWDKFIMHQQTEVTYKKKIMLWKHLNALMRILYPNCHVFLVGSTMNGFASNDSDVDVCLLVKPAELDVRSTALEHLMEILEYLKETNFVEQLEIIHAKVPIITFFDATRKFKVDLNCNNSVGIKNTRLLYCYSKLDWRVKPLALVVKLWAQWHDINSPKRRTLSSYSLVLMVIHFLQCGTNPPVLPCLHSIFANKFKPDADIYAIDIHEDLKIPSANRLPENRQSLGELLFEFFKYYVEFDFSQYAISVRLASKIPKEECRMVQSSKNDPYQWKYLCIEEPFDLTNTARSVYDPDMFSKIIYILKITYSRLKEKYSLSNVFDEIRLMLLGDDWVMLMNDDEE